MVRDLPPFRHLPWHFNYFVNKQNEFLEPLSFCLVTLLAPRTKLREFNSNDFASDERKIENEIVNYSVSHRKKQPCAIKMKRKLHHMLGKSHLRARIVDGKKIIYSKIIRNSSCQRLITKVKIMNFFPSVQHNRKFIKSNTQERSESGRSSDPKLIIIKI